MNKVSIHFLPDNSKEAKKLGKSLGIPVHPILVHTFPDGESRVRVYPVQGTVIIYASLNSPNEKLWHLALAASAFNASGARRLILVAPYLCYMRQDMEFNSGEAVSQHVIGAYLSNYFDRLITVDPHLHRTDDLQCLFTNCKADTLSAMDVISEEISKDPDNNNVLLVGPDSESRQWVGAIANKLGVPFLIGEKVRDGDRQVRITFTGQEGPAPEEISAKHVIIIDDVISSGMTIRCCAETLKQAGAETIEVISVHILCSDGDMEMMKAAGVSRLCSTDSIPHPTNRISLTSLLKEALTQEL
ncbi:ribose-phosphate diphosphokinase [Kiloniella sp.]|uniref:ribose-phosphate diphosphokinase n=1 Tax=Kiloniella sp. TaxID=1938587 RepID=UPI003B012880